jgi:uncharacterized protein
MPPLGPIRLAIVMSALAVFADGPRAFGDASAAVATTSQYISMPDGVQLAADIHLPGALQGGHTVPTIAMFTRYWRSRLDGAPELRAASANGYAVVVVDVRGSGASFGTRHAEVSACEIRDFSTVIDWISHQPWSNGRVATLGTSYVGDTAEDAMFEPSKALKATVPRFTDFDLYTSVLFPGGVRNKVNTDDWGEYVAALDSGRAPASDPPAILMPVNGDQHELAAAIAEHAGNLDVTKTFRDWNFSDDILLANSLSDDCTHWVTAARFKADVERSAIPAYHWAGWMDAGTAAGVLARFASFNAPARYVIGPWSHGAIHDADPFDSRGTSLSLSYTEDAQFSLIFDFLRPYMSTSERPPHLEHSLTYYTMGERRWKQTSVWPPTGVRSKTLYLGPVRLLSPTASSDRAASDAYDVDFDAGTGANTRWSTQNDRREVDYGDRSGPDKHLLTYDSAPLRRSLEITGFPEADIYLESSTADGVLIGYLEAVAPGGRVIMLTEGELRLINRKVSKAPLFPVFGPYHTYVKADARPMVPGVIDLVPIVMLPTSIQVPAGYRLRLAIAGHDEDSFYRFPQGATPRYHVYRDRGHASRIVLPEIPGT